MLTKFSSHQSIKSADQRALAASWDRLAAGRRFPAFAEFKLEPGVHDPKRLVVWDIEGEGRLQKFRALYQGENVAEAFNSTWAGKTMAQVVPMSLRRVTLDAAKECAASGCLIYTIVSTIDTNENRVDCERLLLPFGRDGSKVDQILASLRLTSVPGGFRRNKILSNFQMQAHLLFSGRIRSGFTEPSTPTAIEVDEVVSKAEPDLKAPLGISNAGTSENRRAARRNVLRAGRISFGRKSITCTIRNLSATGASIEATNLSEIPDTFTLVMEMESAERLCRVAWRKKTRIGIQFG